jgi:hypothetical protein
LEDQIEMRIRCATRLFIAMLALCCSEAFAQQAIGGYNPGPSVNVKTFGAYGDTQFGSGGTNPANNMLKGGTTTGIPAFAASDIGKTIWIDKAPFPAPVLAGITVPGSCPGGGKLTNNRPYPLNVYYRIAYTGTAGVGDVSVEGFIQIPQNTSNTCVKITGPGSGPGSGYTGLSGYKVYFASDAPLRWVSQHFYTGPNTVLDSNGNIEYSSASGTTGCYPGPPPACGSDPAWTTTVGNTTMDGGVGGITWTNEGPPIPGSGSGFEVYQAPTTVCGTGGNDPGVSASCEVDTIQSGGAPPKVTVFNGGKITSVDTVNNIATFQTSLGTAVLQGNNYSWGHDDSTAITNAIMAMQGLASGGTLFFPMSSGCYGLTQTVSTPASGGYFLALTGEGSASSQMLGGPGTIEQRSGASCIATISGLAGTSQSGLTFPALTMPISQTNAGPIVERLAFVDPFGSTNNALTFYTNASTRVLANSFQGYASGTAILFDAQETSAPTPYNYNQFVQVADNICLSVQSCVVMKNGATNPAWIERNRCVSAQMGGGRCVQLGPNLLELPPYNQAYNAGATNWIVENFALYFPISYESMDQYADYWIGNSNQQTASLQMPVIPNIIGGGGSGTAMHVGASASGAGMNFCHDNEIIGGNNSSNAIGLFIDELDCRRGSRDPDGVLEPRIGNDAVTPYQRYREPADGGKSERENSLPSSGQWESWIRGQQCNRWGRGDYRLGRPEQLQLHSSQRCRDERAAVALWRRQRDELRGAKSGFVLKCHRRTTVCERRHQCHRPVFLRNDA